LFALFHTVEKVVLPHVNDNFIKDFVFYKIKKSQGNIEFFLGLHVFANLNSIVPSYADEFKLTKYNFLFRSLTVCCCNRSLTVRKRHSYRHQIHVLR